MTLREAIDKVDGQKPNKYTAEEKVAWLSDLDFGIYNDVILTHEHDADIPEFKTYDATDLDKTLIADEPYCQLYTAYLKMKIDEENGDTTRYNNAATLFNAYYDNYAKHINKTRMPIFRGNFHYFH